LKRSEGGWGVKAELVAPFQNRKLRFRRGKTRCSRRARMVTGERPGKRKVVGAVYE